LDCAGLGLKISLEYVKLELRFMEGGVCRNALLALRLTLYLLMFSQQLFVSRWKNSLHSFIVGTSHEFDP